MVMLVILGVLFLAGAGTGCMAVLVIGIHREEKARTLAATQHPGRLLTGTRAINGVFTRGLGASHQSNAHARDDLVTLASNYDNKAA